jgi:hypothetical protein
MLRYILKSGKRLDILKNGPNHNTPPYMLVKFEFIYHIRYHGNPPDSYPTLALLVEKGAQGGIFEGFPSLRRQKNTQSSNILNLDGGLITSAQPLPVLPQIRNMIFHITNIPASDLGEVPDRAEGVG